MVKGDDPSLVDQRVSRLLSEIIGNEPADLVVDDISEEASADVVVDACQTPPFLTASRVVLVRSAGRFTTEDVEPIVAYLSRPLETSVLVLVAGGGAFPTRLQKAVKQHGHVIDTTVAAGKAMKAWFQDEMRNAPVELTRPAAALLEESISGDPGTLRGVLDALATAYGEGASIGPEQVEPFLGSAGASAPWELTDAMDAGDVKTALQQLRRMITGGQRHPLVVMAILQRHFGSLLRLHGSGLTEAEAATALKVSPFPAKKLLARSRHFDFAGLNRAISLLAEADIALRGASALSPELTLEVLVARLCRLTRPVTTGRRPAR